jgi:hypothetical protein
VLDEQANAHALGSLRVNSQWQQHKSTIDHLLEHDPVKALQVIGEFSKGRSDSARLVDTLELYAPSLKGLQEVQRYTSHVLESVVSGNGPAKQAAAFLLGHTLAMYPLTAETISLTIENM